MKNTKRENEKIEWKVTGEEEETFNRMGEEESSEDGCCLVVVLILMNDWIATFIPLFIYRQVIAYLNTKRWCNIWWYYQK